MPAVAVAPLLDELAAAAQLNVDTVTHTFAPLPDEALLWKPAADRWSIAECLQHLNLTNRHYVEAAQRALAEAPPSGPAEAYTPTWAGRQLYTRMHPDRIDNRVKTFGILTPASADLDAQAVLAEYLTRAGQTVVLIGESRAVDLGRIRVPSALVRMLRFKLGDVLQLVVYHDQRHLLQARRVLDLQQTQG